MIVAERKPFQEIAGNLEGLHRIAVVGCATCVTVCSAGGEKEVSVLASLLRIAAKEQARSLEVIELMVERQCDIEFCDMVAGELLEVEAAISLGCGAGVQTLAGRFERVPILPGLNTQFLGMPQRHGVWEEMCVGCGDCMLDRTGGICPVTRCAKSCLNGPCGGSTDGKCEIDPEVDCAWQLIIDKLARVGRLDELERIEPVKDWSGSHHSGPRRIVREDLAL